MMDLTQVFQYLLKGFEAFTWANGVMILLGCVLIYLAVAKEIEPVLLLPIGVGCIFANVGMPAGAGIPAELEGNWMNVIYNAGIKTELFPLLIFVGVGAMIDFRPLLAQPRMVLLGAAGQFGIYGTLILAVLLGFPMNEAASIGVIGAIDGPTAIFVTTKIAPDLLGPVAVAAYSYMSLVPIIQPPVMRLLTTDAERRIRPVLRPEHSVSRDVRIIFPIAVTLFASVVAPASASLIGFLMLGNLIRECGVLERLSKGAQNELANIVTLLLGISISATMTGEQFLRAETLMVIAMGLVAFVFDTAGGVVTAKIMNLFLKEKINPFIGAAGISAFPMASRVVQKMGQQYDRGNHLLMHAVGANVAGQIGSVLAGGLLLSFIGRMAG